MDLEPQPQAPLLSAPRTVLLWTLASALGEGVGLLGGAVIGATVSSPATVAGGPWLSELFLLLTGMLEGACLGAAQEVALRRIHPELPAGRWTLASAVGMGVGWIVATHLDDPFAVDVASDSQWMAMVLGAGLGVALGATVGLAQAWVLSAVRRARSWVVASAVAWVIGMTVSFLGNSQVPPGEWTAALFGIVFLTGVATGAVVGLITSLAHLGDT